MGAPWWVTVLIGLLGVAGAVYGARAGARQAKAGADEQATAAAREEWFRRLQWAAGLTFSTDTRSQVAGYAVLRFLASSTLASPDDLRLLGALNSTAALDEATRAVAAALDEPVLVADDGGQEEVSPDAE